MRAEFTEIGTLPERSWRCRVLSQRAFDFRWHFHPEFELTLITRGTGTRMIASSIENYQAGDLTLIGSEVAHAYVSTPGTTEHEAVVVQFHRDFLGADFFSRPELAPVARLLDVTTAAAATVLDADAGIVGRCRTLPSLAPAEQTLALLSLLLELPQGREGRQLDSSGLMIGLSPAARQRLDAVCAYLQERFTGDIRLAEAAHAAHLSPAAFSRFFRRSLGRTMTRYVMELRIARARELLRDSDLPIAEIATRCGYDNRSNFNRRFRTIEGRSPGQYRRASAHARVETAGTAH